MRLEDKRPLPTRPCPGNARGLHPGFLTNSFHIIPSTSPSQELSCQCPLFGTFLSPKKHIQKSRKEPSSLERLYPRASFGNLARTTFLQDSTTLGKETGRGRPTTAHHLQTPRYIPFFLRIHCPQGTRLPLLRLRRLPVLNSLAPHVSLPDGRFSNSGFSHFPAASSTSFRAYPFSISFLPTYGYRRRIHQGEGPPIEKRPSLCPTVAPIPYLFSRPQLRLGRRQKGFEDLQRQDVPRILHAGPCMRQQL